MAIRTVRLDEQTERTLQKLRRDTGLIMSEIFRRSLEAYAAQAQGDPTQTPYYVYQSIALGDGGWATAPARDAKRRVREAIAGKHRR